MVLISTPKASDANAYVDEATASARLAEGRLHVEVWTLADVPTREAALIWATRLLDLNYNWFGGVRTAEQSLRWPRTAVYNQDGIHYDYDTIPEPIEWATIELALGLLEKDRTQALDLLELGIETAKLDVLSVKLNHDFAPKLFTPSVRYMLNNMGTPRAQGDASGGSGVVTTLRS